MRCFSLKKESWENGISIHLLVTNPSSLATTIYSLFCKWLVQAEPLDTCLLICLILASSAAWQLAAHLPDNRQLSRATPARSSAWYSAAHQLLSWGWSARKMGSWLFALSQSTICPYSVKAKGSVRCQGVSYLREAQYSHNIWDPCQYPLCHFTSPGGPQTKPSSGLFLPPLLQSYLWMNKWQTSQNFHFAGWQRSQIHRGPQDALCHFNVLLWDSNHLLALEQGCWLRRSFHFPNISLT